MRYLFFLIPLIIIILTLYPSLKLPLNADTHEHLSVIHGKEFFDKNLSFLYPEPVFYLKHYNIQFTLLAAAYKLFGFDSQKYYLLGLILKLAAAFSIYIFVLKWTKNNLAAVVSALFFGVSTAAAQNVIRISLFQIYFSIIFLFLFLDRWITFHHDPNKKNLILSLILFVLAILSHPIRMAGLVFLAAGGEIYFLSKFNRYRLLHFLLIGISIYFLIFVTGSISSTAELSAKMISPKILFTSLMTGSYPVITSFLLFISNLIISPFSFSYGFLSLSLIKNIIPLLPVIGILLFLYFLKNRKIFFAVMSLPLAAAPFFTGLTFPYLTDWEPVWVITAQIGITIFILLNLTVLFLGNRNKSITSIGYLGSAIVISNLLLPWMVTSQASLQDQSPFLFIHRYYTIPSVGLGMLLGSVLILSIQTLKPRFNLRLISLFLPFLIFFLILIQVLTTNKHLLNEGSGVNTQQADLLWNKFKIYSKNFENKNEQFYVYIEHQGNLKDEQYIKDVFPRRIEIQLAQIINPPKVKFIFSKDEASGLLNKDFFYAFMFDGINLYKLNQ